MLQDCDLMDYSLLLIIIEQNYNNAEEQDELENLFREPRMIRRIFRSENQKYIYCLGIIDYLQKYDFKKAIEHKLKRIVHDDRASAVDSKLYAFRLQKYVNKHLFDFNN